MPGFLERILPTAGSILGGIGGGIAGAAAAPFTGGVINPVDAGIAGASLGDVAGKAGENALTGQNVKNDLGSSAAQGAIGQAAGGVLGGIATKTLGGIVSPLADTLAGKFVQGQVAPGLMTGSAAKDLLNNYGITNLSKSVPTISDVITGSSDAPEGQALANKAVENALTKSPVPHIDISDLGGNFTKTGQPINPMGKSFTQQILDQTHGLSVGDQKAILNNTNLELSKLPTTIGGATDNMSAFNLSRSFANKAGDLSDQASRATGSARTSLQATSDVYDQLAKELQDRVLSPNGQDINVSPEDKITLQQGITKQLGNSEPQAATQINKDIEAVSNPDGSISARNLRGVQAKWVVARQGLEQSQDLADKYGGMTTADLAKSGLPIAGAVASGGKGLIGGTAAALTKSSSLDAASAKGLDTLGDLTSTGSNPGGVLLKGLGVKNQDASLINKVLPLASRSLVASMANAPNEIATENGNGVQSNGSIQAPGASPVNPAAQNPLAQLYDEIIAQSQSPTGISGNLITTANSIAPTLQKQQLAVPVIQNLLSAYNNAGGAQGTGGGLLSKLTGLIPGTPANTFNAQSAAAADQLASILGITPQAAAALIPQLTQNAPTAAPQVSGLQSVLGNISVPSVTSAAPAQ